MIVQSGHNNKVTFRVRIFFSRFNILVYSLPNPKTNVWHTFWHFRNSFMVSFLSMDSWFNYSRGKARNQFTEVKFFFRAWHDNIFLAGWRSQPASKIRYHIPFVVLGVKNCFAFLTFPHPVPVPKNCVDFYWPQRRGTCKSGWIAQAEKRYCVSKGGKSKVTV